MRNLTDDEAIDMWLDVYSRRHVAENFMAQAHVMVIVKDVERDVILWCNKTCEAETGKTREELIGSPSEVGWPDLFEKFAADDRDIMASGEDRMRVRESADTGGSPMISTSKYICEWNNGKVIFAIAVNPHRMYQQIMEHDVGRAALPHSLDQIHQMMDELLKDYGTG